MCLTQRIIFCLLLCSSLAFGQEGARSAALGSTNVNAQDAWVTLSEISKVQQVRVGIAAHQPFLLRDLNQYHFAFLYPKATFGVFRFSFEQTRFSSLYSNTIISLDYGRKLADRLSAGMSFHYHTLRAVGDAFFKKRLLSADFAVRTDVNDEVGMYMEIQNITQSSWKSQYQDDLPMNFQFLLTYRPYPSSLYVVGVKKELGKHISVHSGMEYKIKKSFALRAGMTTAPFTSSIGFGWVMKSLRIDLASVYHLTLGVTPHFSLTYQWKQ